MVKTIIYFVLILLAIALIFIATYFRIQWLLLIFYIACGVAMIVAAWQLAKVLSDK